MVQDVVRSLLGRQAPALIGAGGADDGQARGPAQLRGGHPHAAAGPMDQHHLPGHGPGPLKQGPVSRGIGHAHPGPLGKRDLGRQGVHLGLQAQGFLSIRAAQGIRGIDPVAGGHPFDPRAHRRHHPGGVGAGGVGQGRGGGISAGPDVGFHRVDPHGVDLNQNLAGAYLGLRRPLPGA